MPSAGPSPVTDLTEDFAELADLRRRAVGGDLVGALADLTSLRANHADDLSLASLVLAETDGIDAPLDQLLAEQPADREARSLWAHRAIVTGWAIRTGRQAEDVSEQQFTAFHERLRAAEQALIRLCAEDPADAHAWSLRLVTARGLELGLGESRRRYDRLRAVDPHHVVGQRAFLQVLCPKWGGDWDQVFALAREVSSAARPGSLETTLVVNAHLERWLEEQGGGDRGYLVRPEVLSEIERAADRFLAAPCPSAFGWVVPHTELAVLFGVAGRRDRSAAHFRALGPALAETPWAYASAHHELLEGIRGAALAVGGRR
jgi:hypothetical protein